MVRAMVNVKTDVSKVVVIHGSHKKILELRDPFKIASLRENFGELFLQFIFFLLVRTQVFEVIDI
jgi:hypothetical protein